jgi:hypothetical protein
MIRRLVFSLAAVVFTSTISSCNQASSTAGEDAVDTNLAAVSSGMLPKSLTYSSGTRTLSDTRNPCAGYNLYSCQPVLLRLYMYMAKQMFDMTRQIFANVKEKVKTLPSGSSGTGEVIQGVGTLDYKKTSSSVFSLLIKQTSTQTPIVYLDASENAYTIKSNISTMSEGESSGKIEIAVTFTNENTWSISVLLTDQDCEANDVRAPRSMRIIVNKADGIWKGKAQLYNGVWMTTGGSDPTCSTQPADSTSMNFYTDFVADDTAAKANVYMMPRDKNSLTDIVNWGMDSFCTKFLSGVLDCANWYNSQNGANVLEYKNPFCNPENTKVAVWNDSCGTYSSAVSTADLGAASDWVTPYDFYQLSASVPSSLP